MDKKTDKRVVQDIVTSGRRRIREVEEEIPIRRIRTMAPPAPVSHAKISQKRPHRKVPSILVTFIVVFIGIAVIAVALSLLYSKAAVTITPKTAHFDVSTIVTTKKSVDSSFGYDVVSISTTSVKTVPAVDGPTIETKAKGSVTLYNEQTVQQKILAGTRLSNSQGLIYRTAATVVIPPISSGKTPGNIVVAVLADQAGASYNISQSSSETLKVVAYKDGPKYSTVYAKVKTAITGGFSGNKKTISPEAQAAATQNAKDEVKAKLVAQVQKFVPKDSVMYDTAYTIDYEVADPVAKDPQTAEITVKGTLSGAEFKKNDLLKAIAPKELDKFSAPAYRIDGIEDLKFSVVNTKDFSAKKATPLIFNIRGPITLVGTFSDTALKNELKGTYLKESNAIFAHYPAISNAYALITPFWMRYFPNSVDKISVEIKDPTK